MWRMWCVCVLSGIESRDLPMVDKFFTIKLHPQPFKKIISFWDRVLSYNFNWSWTWGLPDSTSQAAMTTDLLSDKLPYPFYLLNGDVQRQKMGEVQRPTARYYLERV